MPAHCVHPPTPILQENDIIITAIQEELTMREEQPCRHGGCNKQFSSVTTRNEHERSVSHCCVGDCPACKEKEERNEQEEQNQQERGRKRKEWEDETERCW